MKDAPSDTIAHQAALKDESRERIHSWYFVASRQCQNCMASLDGPWSIMNDECAGPTLHKGVKGDLKVEVAAASDHNNFTPSACAA